MLWEYKEVGLQPPWENRECFPEEMTAVSLGK